MEQQLDFTSFADVLFSHTSPPEPHSFAIDLSFDDNSNATMGDFLYDLFVYGFRLKFGNVPLTDLDESHFCLVRDYIRAIGYESELVGFRRNEDGEVTHVDVGFCPLT